MHKRTDRSSGYIANVGHLTVCSKKGVMSGPQKIEFLERIGSGGMAEVYRARLSGLAGFSKTVVVKRLKSRFKNVGPIVRMFVDEARLSAEVQHKNIVQVFEFLEHQGEMLIVMEYVPGSDLRRVLRKSAREGVRLPVWLSLHVVAEVLEGLAFAHDLCDDRGRPRGIVHRDIAPDNVFLSRQGDVKLGDFGIAQQASGSSPELDDHVKGKLPYMAPELFDGEVLDRRVDIFAASVLLWECLTQRRLFKRKTHVETVRAICLDRRVPPSHYATDVPKELDRIVLAGLEVDPRRRIQSAAELQAAVLGQLARIRPTMRSTEVRSTIRALLEEDAPASADDLIIDVVEEEPVPQEEILELSPWDVVSDSGVSWATPTPSIQATVEPEERTPPPMLIDSWDSGHYTIIGGKHMVDTLPGAAPPIPARPGKLETGDMVALPKEPIPMPGGPGYGETADILRPSHSETYEAPPQPRYRLESSGMELGPFFLDEVMERVRGSLEYQAPGVSISADDVRWIPIRQFLELTGQEIGGQDQFLPRGAVSGSLSSRSIVALLGEMARRRVTGRLVVAQASLPPALRREVHFFQGQPTHVGTTDPDLQPPKLLVEHGLVTETKLEECLHAVISERRALEYVLSKRANLDVDGYRAFVMTMRLESIFDWSSGHFAFDSKQPPRTTRPFASSIYGLLPLLIDRKRTTDALQNAVGPYVNHPFARSSDFREVVSMLNLAPGEIGWLDTLPQFRNLADWMMSSPIEERRSLILTHLLLELGLLRHATARTKT